MKDLQKAFIIVVVGIFIAAMIKSCYPIYKKDITQCEYIDRGNLIEVKDTDLWLYTDELIEDSQKVQHNPDTLAAQAMHDTKPVW